MSLVKTLLIGMTAAIMAVLVYGKSVNIVDSKCMACLCEASTNCTASSSCGTPPGSGGFYCGPFHMSWEYWADAGKPIIKGDDRKSVNAFKNCALDLHCSAKAVENYFNKYAFNGRSSADCDGDGVVDCVDFAYIHKLGIFGCKDNTIIGTDFYKRFDKCWKVLQAASG